MTDKQFVGLMSPLQRIDATSERTERAVNVLNITSTEILESSKEALGELKEQTLILGDIRLLLDDIRESNNKIAGRGKSKPMKLNLFSGVGIAGFMIAAAAGLAGASYFLGKMATVSPMQLATALAISVAFIPIIDAFSRIYRTFRPIASTGFLALSMLNNNLSIVGNAVGMKGLKGTAGKGRSSSASALASSMIAMMGMGVVVMALSYVLKLVVIPTGVQIMTAGLIGLALQPMAMVFVTLSIAMRKNGFRGNKKGLKNLLMTGAAMLIVTAAIVGIAYALKLMPKQLLEPPAIDWVISTSIMMYMFSLTFGRVLKATGKATMQDVKEAGIMMVAMAAAIVGITYALNKMPDTVKDGPPLKWVVTTGIMMLLFSSTFTMLAKTAKKVKTQDALKAGLFMILVAGAFMGIAYAFQYLPDEYKELPSLSWILKVGLALTIIAVPMLILGMIAKSGGGAAALGLGLLAMLLAAGTIVGMAWIFTAMPDNAGEVGANVMDFIMSPVNALVDVLVRFVNEIGIENLLPLAAGILAVAGAFAALAAVSVGSSIASVGAAAGNFVSSAIDKLTEVAFDKEVNSGPMGILMTLADNAEKLKTLAEPLKTVGEAFQVLVAPGKVIGKFTKFLEVLSDNTFAKQSKNLEKVANSLVKISTAANNMSVDAINATNELFKTIMQLSSENADSMETLAEKIVESVKALNSTVDKLDGTVERSGVQNNEFIKRGLEAFKNKTAGSMDQNGAVSQEALAEAMDALRRDLSGVLQVYVVNDEL